MDENEINALAVFINTRSWNCRGEHILAEHGLNDDVDISHQKGSSSSNSPEMAMQESRPGDLGTKPSEEDELICSICLEQVSRGKLVRSLPCFHQFPANCTDPLLRHQGSCTVSKFKLGAAFPDAQDSESDDGSDMV